MFETSTYDMPRLYNISTLLKQQSSIAQKIRGGFYLNKEKIEVPIKGMSKQTFVRGYKVNSKMDANRINGVNLSGHAGRLIESLYESLEENP